MNYHSNMNNVGHTDKCTRGHLTPNHRKTASIEPG